MATKEKTASELFAGLSGAILTHPALTEARQFKRDGVAVGKPKFGASFMYAPESEEYKELKRIAARVARKQWPDCDLKTIRFPFRDGTKIAEERKATNAKHAANGQDLLPDAEYCRGKALVKASSLFPPKLGGIVNGKAVEYEGEAAIAKYGERFYFGAEALITYVFKALSITDTDAAGDKIEKRFVAAYCQEVVVTGKGAKIRSGGKSLAERFAGYKGGVTEDDPTIGDDDIPF
jgi:hypothetical protein